MVVHLATIILAVNSTKFENLLHKRAVIMVARNMMHQKELTYLELPPDEQKLTQRPKWSVISDNDRMAQSKAPQLDRKELKKIVRHARPGRPGAARHATASAASGPPRTGTAAAKTRRPLQAAPSGARRLSAPAPCRRDRR